MTQFGRALRELGVTKVFAHSPEAKGRVERANSTFQGRLVTDLRRAGAGTLEAATEVLADFLPRSNARFGVPAATPGSACRVPDWTSPVPCPSRRRGASAGTTPSSTRGRRCRSSPMESGPATPVPASRSKSAWMDASASPIGETLTPPEAPPLAATLRANVAAWWLDDALLRPVDAFPAPPAQKGRTHGPAVPRGWAAEWYTDPVQKRLHRDLVRAGMEQARQQGKRIGRPRVMDRPDFADHFAERVSRLDGGKISRRQAARQLNIGVATLKRLLDTRDSSHTETQEALTFSLNNEP